jgi:hypothetical protein
VPVMHVLDVARDERRRLVLTVEPMSASAED